MKTTTFVPLQVGILVLLNLVGSRSEGKLESAVNCFTVRLYKQLVCDRENVVSSPFSVNVLLSSLYMAAGGQTARELEAALGYKDLSLAGIEDEYKSKLQALKEKSGNVLHLENSIWLQNTYPMSSKFRGMAAESFFSDVYSVDFENYPRETNKKINAWVKNKTGGLIPGIFDQAQDPSTVMMLVNALFFKGKWEKKFNRDKTRREAFHNHGSRIDTSQVDMLTQRGNFLYNYDQTLRAEILEMDYEGGDLSMVILLPDADMKFEDFEQNLPCDALQIGLNSLIPSVVQVKMPIFKVSSYFDLQSALWRMDIQRTFDPSANLSGIAKNIYLTSAAQKAVFRVGEEGSEGAVVSALVAGKRTVSRPSDLVYFNVDRPFVFLVRHKATKMVLFVGRITELPNYF